MSYDLFRVCVEFDGDKATILQVQRFQIVVISLISQVNTSIEATHTIDHLSHGSCNLYTFCHALSIFDLTSGSDQYVCMYVCMYACIVCIYLNANR